MRRTLKIIIGTIINLVLILVLAISVYGVYYIYTIYKNLDDVTFLTTPVKSATYIYDDNNNIIKTMNENRKQSVTYDELSDHFINALISIEDGDFYKHDGLNYGRILMSFYKNVINGDIVSGGSTLTQQLIKNVTKQDEQTLERKINEAFLALKLEQELTKEEIITLYANQILFDGINKGVNIASLKYFDKDIADVSLPEAAVLAALVKSPSLYNPISHPENAEERKNLVLEMMYNNNYITNYEKEAAQSISVEQLLYRPTLSINQTYPYQAYFDIVYQQAKELTGFDPYYTPMKIHTYLDTELQLQLDLIQKGDDEKVIYNDENQQIAAAVIDNKTGAIIGVIGGRNYEGEKLFNRAYNMKRQPASTLKPILSYSLAIEHLGWSNVHVVKDEPFKYPKTDIDVHNVDKRYMGELFLEEALGYSRNTAALSTLEKVVDEIGMYQVAEYLDNIGVLDVSYDLVNYAYGLGGMYEGVSPVQLASAYRILANEGVYTTPTTIKKIELLDGSNQVIYPTILNNKVLSKETAFMVGDLLTSIVNKNYWGIGYVKVPNVSVAAKTGTSNYDENQARVLGYPSDANKDIWFSGFTPDISLAVWTGFDKALAYQNTYFKANGDARVALARTVFRRIIEIQSQRGLTFEVPPTLTRIPVVKGTYPYLLGDDYTPNFMLIDGYFNEQNQPQQTIKMPYLEKMKTPQILLTENELEINFLDNLPTNEIKPEGKIIFDYTYIYGQKTYFIDVFINGSKVSSSKTSSNQFKLNVDQIGSYTIKIYYRYEKDTKISTPDYEFSFLNLDLIDTL